MNKFLYATLTMMLLLATFPLIHTGTAQAQPTIYVDPDENAFYTDVTAVGHTFTVSVMAADWASPGVFSYEFRLAYDNTMLEAVSAELPTGHWLTPAVAGRIFVVDGGTINHDAGYVSFAATLLAPEEGKTGSGTIAKVTLKITATPALGQTLESMLMMTNVILVNPAATEIPKADYDLLPATYQYISPPPPTPILRVSSKSWDITQANAANGLFNITVTLNGLAADLHVVAIQFFLEFDTTIIATKTAWVYEGDFAKKFGETFFVAYVEENAIVGQLQLPPYPGPQGWMNGSGLVATIQFNATYRTPPPTGSTNLRLKDAFLVDADAKIVLADLEHGEYEITALLPWLSVTPKEATLDAVGQTFNLHVVINELVKGWRLVGTEFKIRYNTTLLETKNEWITEGDFMKEFAQRVGTDTFFQVYVEQDYGLIGIIIIPLNMTGWPLEVFPEGTGVLSSLTFKAKYQLQTEDITSYLQVYDVLLADVEAKQIPVNLEKTETEGKFKYTMLKAYVPEEYSPPTHPKYPYSIDLFTQYSIPYGGQGYDTVSDAFGPQAQILLLASTTYFGDAVAGKPVTYLIKGPNGIEYSAVAVTNITGIAELRYIVPWNTESYGNWTVYASWHVGSETVSDRLRFRVDDLFRVNSVSLETKEDTYTDPRYSESYPVYYKGHRYTLSMTLSTILMQSRRVWSAVTIFDELGQPVGYAGTYVNSAGLKIETMDDYKEFENYVVNGTRRDVSAPEIPVTIGPNAFSGRASVQGNVLDRPGGIAYSGPRIEYIWIQKEKAPTVPPTAVFPIWLSVSNPPTVETGTTFTVAININNVDPSARIVAIEFRLEFDRAFLEAQSVTEGDFVAQFGDTFISWYIDGNVLVGILQLPPYPGEMGWMSGTGTIAEITFKAIYPAPPPAGCPLTLTNAFMVNSNAEPVQFLRLEHGYVSIVGR